ncbi:MAG: hypothetical protein K2L54_00175, partial [Clostridiales bacterium]|nr:hypothetical protein [Clostridiales bacterium]
VYIVEKTSAYGTGYPNCVADVPTVAINIVFKVDNTRPVLNSASNVYDLKVGETKALSLASYISDVDGTVTASTHKITNVIVPSHEFMQLDRYGNVVTVASPNTSYYNIGSKTGTTLTDGMSDRATGFDEAIAYNATKGGTDTSNEAFMRFTYSGITLNAVGLRSSFSQYSSSRASGAPGHFYLLLQIQDLREPSDSGIWLPIAFTVGKELSYTPVATITAPNSGTCSSNLTGQSASALYPTAAGDTGDTFYFAPMAINYNGSHVVGQYKAEDAQGENTGALTNDRLQPLAIDGDSFSTSNGLTGRGAKLNELLTIPSSFTLETFVKSVSSAGYAFADGVAENIYFKAQFIPIYIEKTYFADDPYLDGRVVVNASSTVSGMGFNYLTLTADGNYYVVNGIKITLKSATMNRYFYANVAISDSSGKSVTNGVNIAIRVTNRTPDVISDPDRIAVYESADNAAASSTYEYDPDNQDNPVTTPTFTYKIPLGSKFIVTPYDFAFDPDMLTVHGEQAMLPAHGFTLNGLTARFDESTGTLSTSAAASSDNIAFDGLFDKSVYSADYLARFAARLHEESNVVGNVSNTASGTAASSAFSANQTVKYDKLFFTRTSDSSDPYSFDPTTTDFIINKSNTDSYITVKQGTNVQIGSVDFGMDFVMFIADTRTTRPAIVELTVRDRYGDASTDGGTLIPVRIIIEVVNTSPKVKDASRYEELAVSPINSDGGIQYSEALFSANGNKGANGLMTDPDDDTPEFITSRGTFLANTNTLAKDYANISSFTEIPVEFSTDDGTPSGRPLSSYVSASLISRFELSVTALSSTKALENGVYVYFFVSDGNGGSALGFVRIEVVNSAPVRNASSDNGFNAKDPLWAIETTSLADIARNRYIVGSTATAEKLKAARGATDADIKLISTDYDGLHNSTVLAPVKVETVDNKEVKSNVNLTVPADKTQAIARATFEKAVPDVAVSVGFSSATDPVAVTVFSAEKTDGGFKNTAILPESQFYAGFLFLVNGKWVDRNALLDELAGKTISQVSDFFDEQGRWILSDWALHLQAARGFKNRLGITMSVRDSAELGGDTAGLDTAFASDRKGNCAVNGRLETTVYQSVMSTGIRTKDEYSAYNGYYVVEHSLNGVQSAYVPTFDNDKNSVYTADDNVTNITYNTVGGKNILVTDGSGTTTIKTRGVGDPDNTFAGTNAGEAYSATKDYSNSGAYKYPSVIEIPYDPAQNVYVPMSYFGLIKDLIGIKPNTVGSVLYLTDYVGYDVGSGVFDRANINSFGSKAINLTDGINSWGYDGDPLEDNPYIDISAFDDYSANGSTSSAAKFTQEYSAPYYNNRLSVPTINGSGELIGYERDGANKNNFIGNGALMYLEDQAKGLQEHNFGLVFKKKDVRTGVRNLTLTIKLARSTGNSNS